MPLFEGASDILDAGCGRSEFLALLKEQGIGAEGVDINKGMIEARPAAWPLTKGMSLLS